jgi:uncharacterized tellurite resistance protein B-like protein
VSFAADARGLFGARTWAELQQLAIDVGAPFHDEAHLPTVVGYAWRVALDRKNVRQSQGVMWFVFDGPATSAHLDLLEAAARRVGAGFGPATVERTPANGAPSIYLFDGRPHVVWSTEPEIDDGGPPRQSAEPWLRKLILADGRISPVLVWSSVATDDERLPGLPAVVGVPAPYTDSEREVERMRLAFALRFVDRIVAADGVVRDDERAFVSNVFPPDLLERLGLTEAPVVEEYFDEARESLPVVLGHHDKLALVGLFFSACASDGQLDAREMRILKEGGELLGLTRDEVVNYLRRLW